MLPIAEIEMGLRFTLKALLPELDFVDSVAAIREINSGQYCQKNEYGFRCKRILIGYFLMQVWFTSVYKFNDFL